MSYTDVFGPGPVGTGRLSYRAITLSSNLTLQWPGFHDGSNVTADLMDVTPSGAGFSITLDSATKIGSVSLLVRNLGSDSFNVLASGGGSIQTVAPGTSWLIYLINNSTAAGTWRSLQYGTGTSSADASALAGLGLTALSGTLNLEHDVETRNSTGSVTTGDRSKTLVWTGGTGTFNYDPAASLGNGFFHRVRNSGSGNLTLDPDSSELIDGASTVILAPGEACDVICSGTTLYTVGQGRSLTVTATRFLKNLTAEVSPYTETASEAANQVQEFTGTLTGAFTIEVPASVALYYVYNNTSGGFAITVKTPSGTGVAVSAGQHRILYCDGTDVGYAQDTAAGTVTSVATGTGLTGGPITTSGTVALVVPMGLASGSAGAPTFSFSGDTDTGIYLAGSNLLGLAVGGAGVMVVGSPIALTGVAINTVKAADLASGTTTDIGAVLGNSVDVTGNATITGLGTVQAGTLRFVRFTGTPTLTHNATSLILPSGANIAVAAGDRAVFMSLGSGNWLCVSYQRADGKALVETAAPTVYGFTTGDAKFTMKTTADAGFVMMDDGTIGSAASLATTRANADTEALYTLLWNNVIDTWAPVSGGRGANAAADFAANKTIALTKQLGRAIIIGGAGFGLTSRALGETLGEEDHELTTAEMPAHTHTMWDTIGNHANNVSSMTSAGNNVSGGTTGSTGGGDPHNNMQPSTAWNVMIKL